MINKSLSNKEILKLIKHKANLISYTQIHGYKSLDDLMGPYGACIILYETKQNYGHWCCIFKLDDNAVEFFDPYGIFPDHELFWIKKEFRVRTKQNYPYLSHLMMGSVYILTFNHYRFQKYEKGINSCGRWCALRLIFRKLPLQAFIEIFDKDRPYTKDFYVTLLTNYI